MIILFCDLPGQMRQRASRARSSADRVDMAVGSSGGDGGVVVVSVGSVVQEDCLLLAPVG